MAEQPPENLSFEQALVELDAVTQKLEDGRTSLEESLRLLERGQALAAHCEGVLDNAESVLEQLVISRDGELERHQLEWADEDDENSEDEDEA
jgi:exodeoxyribonuclease VII small subunit